MDVDRRVARFQPIGKRTGYTSHKDRSDEGVNWVAMGRPGLDPGTLGLKERFESSIPFG